MVVQSYRDLQDVGVNKLVPFYIMSSYLYYKLDVSIFNDHEFNDICQRLKQEYTNITHPHKEYVKLHNLEASTGFNIKFTKLMKHASIMWYETVTGNIIDNKKIAVFG